MPARSSLLLTALAGLGLAAGASAAVDHGALLGAHDRAAAPAARHASVTARRAPRGIVGRRGPLGARGAAGDPSAVVGPPGPAGPQGPPGRQPIAVQAVAIAWQNGQSAGRDRQTFTAPGIGSGVVVCNTDEQMLRFTPDDPQQDTVMWTLRTDDRGYTYDRGDDGDRFHAAESPVAVRTARRTQYTGPTFNEGMNLRAFEPTDKAIGSWVGLISSHGDRDGAGGPTQATTGFRLTWHWNFRASEGAPRCYVSGSFTTETP